MEGMDVEFSVTYVKTRSRTNSCSSSGSVDEGSPHDTEITIHPPKRLSMGNGVFDPSGLLIINPYSANPDTVYH